MLEENNKALKDSQLISMSLILIFLFVSLFLKTSNFVFIVEQLIIFILCLCVIVSTYSRNKNSNCFLSKTMFGDNKEKISFTEEEKRIITIRTLSNLFKSTKLTHFGRRDEYLKYYENSFLENFNLTNELIFKIKETIKNENTSLSNEEIEKLNNIVEQLEDNKEIIKCATITNSGKIDEINEKIKTIVDNATTQFEKIKNKLEQLKLTHKTKEYDYVDRIIGIGNKYHDKISEFLEEEV